MARTISEIYDALNTAKGSMSELGVYVNNDAESVDTAKKLVNDVRTASKVAIWRLWLWIVAVGSWVIEKLQDSHEAAINAIIAADKPHTLAWYAAQSKLWQYGYELAWLEDHYAYSVIDESARIVKYSAAIEGAAGVTIKAMKAGRAVLSAAELAALAAFWKKWKDAGVALTVKSQAVNLLSFDITVYRNRSIVNADNTLIADPTVNVLEDPANGYVESVDFNGIVYVLEMIQRIKDMPGITNVILANATIDDGTWGDEGLWTVIPASGFCEIAWGDCTITYSDIYE